MKAVKIILVIAVISAIGFVTCKSLVKTGDVGEIPLSTNPFTESIEKEIDSLSKMPDNRFCREFYDKVNYLIDDYYKNGRFNNNPSVNEQVKENFTKNLYSVYSDKFIRQAFYVFNGTKWDISDLRFITDEYQTLQKSQLLESGSPVDKELAEIRRIINKYNEIIGFVADCRSFSYTSYGLSNRFPVSEVKNKISRMNRYINDKLENRYVNNCIHLHNELKAVPQILFNKHVDYLSKKIQQWSEMYDNYNSQSDYANNLYTPLKNEIILLDNEVYNVASAVFDNNYNKLMRRWNNDSKKAYEYFSDNNNN
jgi:hypothetical protein